MFVNIFVITTLVEICFCEEYDFEKEYDFKKAFKIKRIWINENLTQSSLKINNSIKYFNRRFIDFNQI